MVWLKMLIKGTATACAATAPLIGISIEK